MEIINFLSKKRSGNTLAILIVVVFLILGLIRLYPYVNTLEGHLASELNDDWVWYARLGMDIKKHGIPLPPASYPFPLPSGFLYYYFIALCFLIFGENLIPIYIIHHIMMGLSVALIYWTFRDKMRSITSIIFLGALSLFTLLDVYKYYAIRLLSENLMFFTIALFFFCFIRGFQKDNLKLQLFSAFLMGTIILTRFNMLLYGFILILIVAPFYLKRRPRGIVYLFLFIIIMGLTVSSLPVRNYLVCGRWRLFPTIIESPLDKVKTVRHPIPQSLDLSGIDINPLYLKINKIDRNISIYLEYIRQKPQLFFSHYSKKIFKKILFCLGFTSVLNPNYRWRPHWMLMWIGFLTYLLLRIRERQKFKIWELAILLYLVCYYITVLMFVEVHNYGFRLLIPATNFVLLFSFLALDKLGYIKGLEDKIHKKMLR